MGSLPRLIRVARATGTWPRRSRRRRRPRRQLPRRRPARPRSRRRAQPRSTRRRFGSVSAQSWRTARWRSSAWAVTSKASSIRPCAWPRATWCRYPHQQRRCRARRGVPRVQRRHRPGRIGRARAASPCSARTRAASSPYFCSLPGHRQAGMEGKLTVGSGQGAGGRAAAVGEHRARPRGPAGAAARRAAAHGHQVELEAVELVGKLANETTYTYWTFNGKVPGPFLRVRVGDTVELTFKNREDSRMIHSVDLHAVDRPRGRRGDDADAARARRRRSASRRSTRGCTSTTARRPWWRTTSRAGCTG